MSKMHGRASQFGRGAMTLPMTNTTSLAGPGPSSSAPQETIQDPSGRRSSKRKAKEDVSSDRWRKRHKQLKETTSFGESGVDSVNILDPDVPVCQPHAFPAHGAKRDIPGHPSALIRESSTDPVQPESRESLQHTQSTSNVTGAEVSQNHAGNATTATAPRHLRPRSNRKAAQLHTQHTKEGKKKPTYFCSFVDSSGNECTKTFTRDADATRHFIYTHLGVRVQCEYPTHKVPYPLSRLDTVPRHMGKYGGWACMGPHKFAELKQEIAETHCAGVEGRECEDLLVKRYVRIRMPCPHDLDIKCALECMGTENPYADLVQRHSSLGSVMLCSCEKCVVQHDLPVSGGSEHRRPRRVARTRRRKVAPRAVSEESEGLSPEEEEGVDIQEDRPVAESLAKVQERVSEPAGFAEQDDQGNLLPAAAEDRLSLPELTLEAMTAILAERGIPIPNTQYEWEQPIDAKLFQVESPSHQFYDADAFLDLPASDDFDRGF